jgi:peroxiredoxin/YHS domain-containing protein
MKRLVAPLLAALALAAVAPSLRAPHLTADAIAAPASAVCPVCRVKEGSNHEEPVKATRTWEGVEYGFCSEACAKAFDAEPAAYVPPQFPREAPAWNAKTLAGKPVSLADYRGQVVLLDFWATWCAPCRKSMPELNALHAKLEDRGFSVLGLSIDEDGPAKVKKYVAAKKIGYPIALDAATATTWEAYRVKAVPAAFLIDREGRIVAQWTGAVDVADVEAKVLPLLQTD